MATEHTKILEVTDLEHIQYELRRMYVEPAIGGVLVKKLLTDEDVTEVIDSKSEFTPPTLQRLFGQIALSLSSSEAYVATEAGFFSYPHEWHLAVPSTWPSVRVWAHLRGDVTFELARATPGVVNGYGFTGEYVYRQAAAPPVSIEPDPGDALCFVDRGLPSVTGESTFHRSIVHDPTSRISIAYDIDPDQSTRGVSTK